jgi:hypothetical protein
MVRNLKIDSSILGAALIGYQHRRDEIDVKIEEIRRQIGGQPPQGSASAAPAEPLTKRVRSAAVRKRMAVAQRKRWAEFKKAKEAPAPVKKRRLSAAGRKRIIEATKKRWAELRTKEAAAEKAARKPAVTKRAAKRSATRRAPAAAVEQVQSTS